MKHKTISGSCTFHVCLLVFSFQLAVEVFDMQSSLLHLYAAGETKYGIVDDQIWHFRCWSLFCVAVAACHQSHSCCIMHVHSTVSDFVISPSVMTNLDPSRGVTATQIQCRLAPLIPAIQVTPSSCYTPTSHTFTLCITSPKHRTQLLSMIWFSNS